MKYTVFAYSCYINGSNAFEYENDLIQKGLTQEVQEMDSVFICKKFKDNNSLISFQVVGEVASGEGILNAISFCMGAAEGIGKQVIAQLF